MALPGHRPDHIPITTEYGADDKFTAEHISNTTSFENVQTVRRKREAPPLVRDLSTEERHRLEMKLVRKIDVRLLPMLVLMYIMNYLDRNNIAAARLAGLQKDLHLTGTQYLTCLSILFVGYLLMQVPSNLFLNKIGKPALYLPTVMIVWGVISAATAGAQSYGGLVAIRFFLGFVEAAYFPGCLFFLSSWYTRKELGFRTAVLYSGSLLSGAFSGLISAGITKNLDGARGLRAWRWLFIIEGVITIAIAFVAYLWLPNFPRTTTWLTENERQLAIWRLDEDIGEDDWVGSQAQSFAQGAKLAFTDVKMYILMVLLFCFVASGTVTNLFPTVVKTLGYSNVTSLLLTVPPYALAVITTFLNAWHADKTGERYFHITLPLYFAVIAYIIAASTIKPGPRYLSMMLMVPGVYTGYVVALAWISNTLPRPPAKRAAALAAINAVSNTSSIYASYMYPDSASPRFIVAMSVNCVTAFIAICTATLLRFILVRLNKKLDRGEVVEGAVAFGEGIPGEAARKGFRYGIIQTMALNARLQGTSTPNAEARMPPPTHPYGCRNSPTPIPPPKPKPTTATIATAPAFLVCTKCCQFLTALGSGDAQYVKKMPRTAVHPVRDPVRAVYEPGVSWCGSRSALGCRRCLQALPVG